MSLFLLAADSPTTSAGINWHTVFFLLYALVACGFGLAVLFTSNIVRMAFYLTISLGAVAGLFILAGAHFVGAMQLMIYVGGTLVLLIFGVMLTAQAQFIQMRTRGGEWVLAAIVGGSLISVLISSALMIPSWHRPSNEHLAAIKNLDVSPDATAVGAGLIGLRVDKLEQSDEQLRSGMAGYLLPFEIASVHLLVVLIGAAYLARSKRFAEALSISRPAAARTERSRSALVTGVLVIFLLAHLACSAFCFIPAWHEPVVAKLPSLPAIEGWIWPVMGVSCVLAALLMLVIIGWQQWGFYALVIQGLVETALIYGAGAGPVYSAGVLVLTLVWLAMLFGVLNLGGRRSMWAQMD